MDCSTPGSLVLHYLPEFAQTHVHWISDAIQPPHPLSPPSSPAVNLSQHQDIFQWVSSLYQVTRVGTYWSIITQAIKPPPQYNQSLHLSFLLPKSSGTPALWLATPLIPSISSQNIPVTCYPNLAAFWAPTSLEHLSRRGWISSSTSLFQGQAVGWPWPWFPLLFRSHLLPLSKS